MPNLHSTLSDLATSFTDSVLEVIRGASLDELIGKIDGGRAASNPRRAARPAATTKSTKPAPKPAKPAAASGRLPRRSAEEITAALDSVVALVKKNKEGLRAEEVRSALGLQAKELPRILKEGLSSRKLKAKGQKRATTYFAV